MKTIKKTDFAKHINKAFGFPAAVAESMVDVVFGEIKESLKRGEEVKIKNFGAFNINDKRRRMGRNPRTGEPAEISARRVPTFRASKEFKNKLRIES